MENQKGIGEGGKTLKQMLEENERLYRETGCYAGITRPHALKEDPVRAELFHSRIMAALIAGRETCRMVSGSPFVREVAELCLGLYTPEGDNIAQSTGIQIHIRLMGDNIQWMVRKDYEEEVGIQDGDFFIANDPVISGMHAADVYDMLPIFIGEELVGWVSTVIMEMDVGAVSPGCMPTANVERGTDGLKFLCEKIGTHDRLNRDFEHKIENSLDMYHIFLLDRKGAMAANIRVREEIKKIVGEFGLDFYKQATRELIEEERRNQVARIKQRMVPGRYRNVVTAEFPMSKQPVAWIPAKVDTIRLIPIQMDILPEGRILLDFEGVGEWGWHPFNGTPNALWGGISIVTVQTLSYDGRGNLGSLLPIDVKEPALDTLLNPSEIKKLATSTPWAPMLDVFGMWMHMLGTAYYIRGFREETFNYRSSAGWQMAGYDQLGNKRPLMAAGTGNFGPGACGVCDGIDCGGWLATPEVDLGSAEVWELFVPHMEMSRRFDPYSVGYGKFRSGLAIPSTAMIHNTKKCVASAALGTASDGIIPNIGQFGGYCGGRRNTFHVRFANFQEKLLNREPLLHELGHPGELKDRLKEMGGEIVDHGLLPEPMEVIEGDLLIAASGAGGGLGDPIERSPDSVKADLDSGFATDWQARKVYCVDAAYDDKAKEWSIDPDATAKLRKAKREERLNRAVPVKEWWKKAREKIMARDMDVKIQEMYRSSAGLSPTFAQEMRAFWALPDDFEL
jgi:N-methylhydantoinase B/oxoprolinase/acetone carboxylase alpha subunit